MKFNAVWMRSLVVASVVVLISGCCRNVDCECVTPTIAVQYESDSLSCISFAEMVKVNAYNTADGQLITEPIGFDRIECVLRIPYSPGRFWVITSDSLNISDTIAVKDISLYTSDDDCCECGNQISSMELLVNGEPFLNQTPVLKF